MTQFEFFALAFGSMIGVGWVTAVGGWLDQAGPVGAIVAFVLGGAIMLCIGLCYAEATPMLPVAGGEVAYARHGPARLGCTRGETAARRQERETPASQERVTTLKRRTETQRAKRLTKFAGAVKSPTRRLSRGPTSRSPPVTPPAPYTR